MLPIIFPCGSELRVLLFPTILYTICGAILNIGSVVLYSEIFCYQRVLQYKCTLGYFFFLNFFVYGSKLKIITFVTFFPYSSDRVIMLQFR